MAAGAVVGVGRDPVARRHRRRLAPRTPSLPGISATVVAPAAIAMAGAAHDVHGGESPSGT
jgi:hypothetical protein